MKNYLEYKRSKSSFSVYYHINTVFKSIEFGFFIFLCIALILTSKIDRRFNDGVSMFLADISIPIVKVGSLPFTSIIDLTTNFQELVNSRNENKFLKEENEKLRSIYINALNISQENKELREILKFISVRSSDYRLSRLIGRSHEIYSGNIFIDSGSDQNIKEDSIVTGRIGVIGRVIKVGANKSRVLLVTDINSKIPIITSGSRTRGVLVGHNDNSMEIIYLDKNHRVKAGDLVFTSGDGDAIPPGLLVGIVKKVDQGYASVQMAENINNVDIVTVVGY